MALCFLLSKVKHMNLSSIQKLYEIELEAVMNELKPKKEEFLWVKLLK
jgi:hypothetical protein